MTIPIYHAIGGVLKRKGRPDLLPVSPFAYRESLTIGAYRPDETTAGLLNDPARPLTAHEGDYTASVAGATVADLEIRGRLIVSADNVTADNCWLRGPVVAPSGADIGMASSTSATRNLLLRDCFIDPRAPGARMDGIRFAGYTAKRCRIRRVVDGFGAFHTSGGAMNVSILGSWVENLTKFYPDEGIHSDGTHNDGVQLQGGSNFTLRGSRVHCKLDPDTGNTGGLNVGSGGVAKDPPMTQGNAAVQLNAGTGALSNITIEDNWLYGGTLGINGLDPVFATASNLTGLVIRRNKFDRDQYLNPVTAGRIAIRPEPTITCPTTGPDANVYMDTGLPVELRRGT